MVIQNGAVETPGNNRTNVVQNQGVANVVQNQGGASAVQQQGSDRVQLSSASSLVALAKGMMPADKQAQFEAINAQFQAGQYQADVAGTSQGVVQGHLKS